MKIYFYSDTYVLGELRWINVPSRSLCELVFSTSEYPEDVLTTLTEICRTRNSPIWVSPEDSDNAGVSHHAFCEYSDFAYFDQETGKNAFGDCKKIESYFVNMKDVAIREISLNLAQFHAIDLEPVETNCENENCAHDYFVYFKTFQESMAEVEVNVDLDELEVQQLIENSEGSFAFLNFPPQNVQEIQLRLADKEWSQENELSLGCAHSRNSHSESVSLGEYDVSIALFLDAARDISQNLELFNLDATSDFFRRCADVGGITFDQVEAELQSDEPDLSALLRRLFAD